MQARAPSGSARPCLSRAEPSAADGAEECGAPAAQRSGAALTIAAPKQTQHGAAQRCAAAAVASFCGCCCFYCSTFRPDLF
eukprot:6202863-Pleurochrysis_carterae.AAC.3